MLCGVQVAVARSVPGPPDAIYTVRPFLAFTAGGGFYCYATESGAVVQVEQPLHTVLERFATATNKTVLAADLRRAGLAPDDVAELIRYGVLCPLQGATAPHPDYRLEPISSVTAVLTSRCNLACRYCYARGEARSPRSMPAETARQTIDFLIVASGAERDVRVTLFGGEPLLNWPALRAMVEYGEEQAQRRRKRIAFALTTNGTLLSPAVVRFLERHAVSLTVSLDGQREVHDDARPRASGKGSYDVLVGKLANLTRHYRGRPPSARITVSSRAVDLVALFDHVAALGFNRIGLSPLAEFEGEYGLDARALDQYLEGFNRLAARFLLGARGGTIMGFANLINLLESIDKGETKTHSCGAGIGMLTVDPAGRIYACHRLVGTEAFALGDVRNGIDPAKRRSFLEQGASAAKTGCRECWARSLCGGGCHYENYRRGGLAATPPEHVCEFYRATATTCLKSYALLREENPSLFSYLMGGVGDAPGRPQRFS